MEFKVGDLVQFTGVQVENVYPDGVTRTTKGIVFGILLKENANLLYKVCFTNGTIQYMTAEQIELVKEHNIIDGWKYFTPFDDLEEIKQYIGTAVRYGTSRRDVMNSSTKILDGISIEEIYPFSTGSYSWRYIGVPVSVPERIKVVIDGKTGYISKESAKELKRLFENE